jgi:hypothetical protein
MTDREMIRALRRHPYRALVAEYLFIASWACNAYTPWRTELRRLASEILEPGR